MQQEAGGRFDLQRARQNLEKLRAEEAAVQKRIDAAAAPAEDTRRKGGNMGATPVGLSGRAAPEPVISLRKQSTL